MDQLFDHPVMEESVSPHIERERDKNNDHEAQQKLGEQRFAVESQRSRQSVPSLV
jgi:hypothetical protein